MKYLTVTYNTISEELEMVFHIQALSPFFKNAYPLTEKQWHVKTYLAAYDFDISEKIYKYDEDGLTYNIK